MLYLNRRTFLTTTIASVLGMGAQARERYYTLDDFEKVRKIDMHFHQNIMHEQFPSFMRSLGFQIISVNVDEGTSLKEQFEVIQQLQPQFSKTLGFVGAFPVDGIDNPQFATQTIEHIKRYVAAGAKGFKVWKNIGMVLKNKQDQFVFIDDPLFTPIFTYMEQNKIPLMAHLGEPKNCWLPLEQITTAADRRYYTRHPEFHMYQRTDHPTYEQLIGARDNLLKRHPQLRFAGAHLASLEWSVDEMAAFLDRFPNAMLDTAARVDHLQYQSALDKARVRDFLITYQDRLMYGSDTTITAKNNTEATQEALLRKLRNDWAYFATNQVVFEKVPVAGKERAIVGLQLPKSVMDKIFYKNAQKFFQLS